LDCSCRLFSTSAILAEPILQDVDTMLPEVWRRSENGKVETRHPNRHPNRKSRRLRFDAIAQLKWVNDPHFGDVRVGEHIAEGINWRAWHSAPVHFLQPFKGGSLFETRRQYPHGTPRRSISFNHSRAVLFSKHCVSIRTNSA
jgi:hypothetical protein